jgi:hypothetical protein
LARVCDIGLLLEKNYHYSYCLHKDYFQGIDPYEGSYPKNIKYDLWAFGALIYYSLKRKQAFFGATSFINPTPKFKEKYLNDTEKWLRNGGNELDLSYFLAKVVLRCWGLY